MKHASFFSGVGGLDLGFERAGITTVSFSEVDPYASAVLAERWPSVPNLGDITKVVADDIPAAEIYSGGFPCQDLSIAGKRAGFAGNRSSLAFTFLDLVERRKPRWVVLENVTGLFSSNGGADFARLITEVEQLGYGVAWRTLDAQYFGVAQRRRRVFIVASFGSDRAAQVLFECEGGCGHPKSRQSSWQKVASKFAASIGTISKRGTSSGAQTHTTGVRAANGVARRAHNQPQVGKPAYKVGNFELYDFPKSDIALTLNSARARDQLLFPTGSLTGGGNDSPQSQRIFSDEGTAPTLDTGRAVPNVFRKSARVSAPGSPETWVDDGIANTLNNFDVGDIRTTHAVLGGEIEENESLPKELDGHRYRCCGNGVVANVAEWIGHRLVAVDAQWEGAE